MNLIVPITDLPIKGKKVLVRVDFNVPIEKGKVVDDSRIKASLPTIQYILKEGGALILMSHLGRPKGHEPEFSLLPVKDKLEEILKKPVMFATLDEMGGKELKPGEIVMLENLRYEPAEEKPEKDPLFAKKLSELADFYVDDAFGSAHRAHASITEVPKWLKGKSGAGFLLQEEVKFLGQSLNNPKRPFIALVGGAKISSKLGVLKSLLKKADKVLIGGAMAYTFMKAEGKSIGKSLFEPGLVEEAKSLKGNNLVIPVDHVARKGGEIQVFKGEIPEGWEGCDIGPETIKNFESVLKEAQTILWNGPVGIFEIPPFNQGTLEIAKFISSLKALKIVGGGDSVAAINQMGLEKGFDHLSTGGGASLEFIEFGTLPGIEVLKK